MSLSNIFLVGFYVSFIIIFLYCYWAYVYYKKSSTRIGMRATAKYYNEMVELDPSRKGLEVKKASVVVSRDGTKATVKFNIFQKEPPVPVGGGVRVYDIVKDQKQCITQTVESRIDSAKCQGILSKNQKDKCTPWRAGLGKACEGIFETQDQQMECYKETSSGLGCLWL